MLKHPNVRLARRAWLAVSRGDVDDLRDLVSDDVVWHTSGRSAWAGEHVGVDGVLEFLGRFGGAADEFNSDLTDILASDDRAVILFHVTGRRRDRRLELDYALVCEIRDGRICRVRAVPFDQYAVDEFWKEPPSRP